MINDDPWPVARAFKAGAVAQMHTVDLEGARDGGTPATRGIVQAHYGRNGPEGRVGGGIRSTEA